MRLPSLSQSVTGGKRIPPEKIGNLHAGTAFQLGLPDEENPLGCGHTEPLPRGLNDGSRPLFRAALNQAGPEKLENPSGPERESPGPGIEGADLVESLSHRGAPSDPGFLFFDFRGQGGPGMVLGLRDKGIRFQTL